PTSRPACTRGSMCVRSRRCCRSGHAPGCALGRCRLDWKRLQSPSDPCLEGAMMSTSRPVLRAALLGLLAVAASAPAAGADAPGGDRAAERAFVDALMAKMTLEEKLGQLYQPRGLSSETGPAAIAASEAQIAS